MSKTNKDADVASVNYSQGNEGGGGKGAADAKQSNTIMQQINNFSLTPMNDLLAKQTIDDHKYLLELVENRCAIAYFSCVNRNQSLFFALQDHYLKQNEDSEDEEGGGKAKKGGNSENLTELEETFKKLMIDYDFMSIIMYPDLRNRREFVHDSWLIAKASENGELKMAISRDPYFYLTRLDLLNLLKTHDDTMITHLLATECMLLMQEDISYKLISIKNAQVDKNQQTPVRLLDFVSVLVQNKREDKFSLDSDIIFSNNYIVKFLNTHSKFVVHDEVVKIFILSRRFRLSLQFIQMFQVPFQIEFFTNAIESDSYDIAFYMLKTYEAQIYANYNKAINAHVQSYQTNNRFLKAKLHMSKSLLSIFNFNAAKNFLEILQFSVYDQTLEGNIFSHSSNPLLAMCLLYELLGNIITKFFSLNNACRTLMDKIMEECIGLIEAIDDQNVLSQFIAGTDFSGRDSMTIFVELELVNLIQLPKIKSLVKRVYNCDFTIDGNLMEMSTPWQILFSNKNVVKDIESVNRFYKRRDITHTPQSMWLYEIFKLSMTAKIQATAITTAIFLTICCIYFEYVINMVAQRAPDFAQIKANKEIMLFNENMTLISETLKENDKIYADIEMDVQVLYDSFQFIQIISVINLSFLFQHVMQFVVIKKMGRFYELSFMHFTDLLLFTTSIITISWFVTDVNKGLKVEPPIPEEELTQRKLSNFLSCLDFGFQYLYSIQVVCLIFRLSNVIQFSETTGPLFKIVGKMSMDFLSFLVLYVILTIMFATIGNLNFITDINKFEGYAQSVLTVFDASMGNYDFTLFDQVRDPGMQIVGKLYMMSIVVIFNILLINLMIAILANTYNIFDERSEGLYMAKILTSRDMYNFHESYGNFLLTMPGSNLLQLLMFPFTLIFRMNDPILNKMNTLFMMAQYCIFMMIFFASFCLVSYAVLPFAWIVGCLDKFKLMGTPEMSTVNLASFILFGQIILQMDFIADMYYFWKNNFRGADVLQTSIIPQKATTVTHRSLRELSQLCVKYQTNKIKSAHTKQVIRYFGRRMRVQQNIQFLIFGQMIPIGGFRAAGGKGGNNQTFKSVKTMDLKEYREEELERLDDTAQLKKSKHELDQYNELKIILLNLAFKDKAKVVFSPDIINDVFDESRRERKIIMVIKDLNVDEYINYDMTELNPMDAVNDKEVSPEIRLCFQEKLEFRGTMAQNIYFTKLDYFFRVMRSQYIRATISDPDAYKDKIKQLERDERRQEMQRQGSSQSMFSMFSKSKKSEGQSAISGSEAGEGHAGNGEEGEGEDDDYETGQDPVIAGLSAIFDEMGKNIKAKGHDRVTVLNQLYNKQY